LVSKLQGVAYRRVDWRGKAVVGAESE
jgi:hypothetical protein